MPHMCPNTICGQVFTSPELVVDHLWYSTCSNWTQDFVNNVVPGHDESDSATWTSGVKGRGAENSGDDKDNGQ